MKDRDSKGLPHALSFYLAYWFLVSVCMHCVRVARLTDIAVGLGLHSKPLISPIGGDSPAMCG